MRTPGRTSAPAPISKRSTASGLSSGAISTVLPASRLSPRAATVSYSFTRPSTSFDSGARARAILNCSAIAASISARVGVTCGWRSGANTPPLTTRSPSSSSFCSSGEQVASRGAGGQARVARSGFSFRVNRPFTFVWASMINSAFASSRPDAPSSGVYRDA